MPPAPHQPGATADPGFYTPGSDDPQAAALRADVIVRIRRVCADMPPEAFDLLVRDICAMKRRWAARSES